MILNLPTVQPGDEIEARHFQLLYDALKRLGLAVAANSGLSLEESAAGILVGLAGVEGFFIKLTSSSGSAYAWTEQVLQSDGTWTDGYRSGTTTSDPAQEYNGNTSIPSLPQVVWAWRVPSSNTVAFQIGAC